MGIRYTQPVKDILEFIDNYGFITVNQCANIIYKGNKKPITQAQQKLKLLYDNKILKRTLYYTGVYVYSKTTSKPTMHKMLLLDLYSYIYNKYEVVYFEKESRWELSKRRNDGHIIFIKDCNPIGLLLEIDYSHATTKNKLDDIYKTGEVQKWYLDNYEEEYFPTVLIVNSSGAISYNSSEYNVVATDFNFNNLVDIL